MKTKFIIALILIFLSVSLVAAYSLSNFGNVFVRGTTQFNDTLLGINANFTNVTSNNFIIANYSRPQTDFLGASRPLFSTRATNLTVCPSGCSSTTIQGALNQVPYFLRHRYIIQIADGTYNEDLFVAPHVTADIVDSVDGSCEALQITGNSTSRDKVKVKSMQISAVVGCQDPAVSYINFIGADPHSDENVSIAVYGSSHPVLKLLSFQNSTAKYAIMAYGSSVTISQNNYGNNSLPSAFFVKHGGVISSNDGLSWGSVTSSLASVDDGSLLLNENNISYVGSKFSYSVDDGGYTSDSNAQLLSNNFAATNTLYKINKFDNPIRPPNYAASANGLVAYYKADTLNDYSGNGFNLTALNSATATDGRFGKAFNSDATNKHWTARNTVLRGNETNFTWFAWAKIDGASTANVIFRTGSQGAASGGLIINGIGSTMICQATLNSSDYGTQKTISVGNVSNWNFYGCSYNGTGLTYYINGKYFDSVDTIDNGALNLSNTALTINARFGGSQNLNGSTDEIMIFNRTLDADEIRAYYETSAQDFLSSQAYYLKQTGTWEGNITIGAICSNGKVMLGINTTSEQIYCG